MTYLLFSIRAFPFIKCQSEVPVAGYVQKALNSQLRGHYINLRKLQDQTVIGFPWLMFMPGDANT